jgi:hypothetical protein
MAQSQLKIQARHEAAPSIDQARNRQQLVAHARRLKR